MSRGFNSRFQHFAGFPDFSVNQTANCLPAAQLSDNFQPMKKQPAAHKPFWHIYVGFPSFETKKITTLHAIHRHVTTLLSSSPPRLHMTWFSLGKQCKNKTTASWRCIVNKIETNKICDDGNFGTLATWFAFLVFCGEFGRKHGGNSVFLCFFFFAVAVCLKPNLREILWPLITFS